MSARYVPLVKIASGGMATVHVGAARGDLGFRRLVAIKRPHPHIAEDPELRAALLEEAHVAARVRHANVVGVQDVEAAGDDVQLVMDYVEGATFAQLLSSASKRGEKLPARVVLRVALDACAGLAAVHEARDEHGAPLGLVHRDISPQNLLVGLDGLARISDFGTAKSALSGRPSTTQGTLKGKLAYMAPEYVGRGRVDRRVDVFAMGVVLWEAFAGKRLFRGANDADTLDRVLREEALPLHEVAPELGARFDEVVARALCKRPEDRWESAEVFGAALAASAQEGEPAASHGEVGRAVREAVGADLEARRAAVRARLAELDAAPRPAGGMSPATGAVPSSSALPVPGGSPALEVPAPGAPAPGAPAPGAPVPGALAALEVPALEVPAPGAPVPGALAALEVPAPGALPARDGTAPESVRATGRPRVGAGRSRRLAWAALGALGALVALVALAGARLLGEGRAPASVQPIPPGISAGAIASTDGLGAAPPVPGSAAVPDDTSSAPVSGGPVPAGPGGPVASGQPKNTSSAVAPGHVASTVVPVASAALSKPMTKEAAPGPAGGVPSGGKRKAPPNPYAPR